MENSENKRSVIVGIFVLLGVVIFVAAILTLGGQQKTFIKSIELNAIFNDVSGLKVGNNVWFSGVKIGTVKKIDFYGISQVKIRMSIEKEAQRYIHKNATAQISSEGFIGNRIIVIDGGTPSLPIVEPGDRIAVKNALSTDQMLSDLQVNNKNLIDITSDLKVISAKLSRGEGTIGALLTDSNMAMDVRKTMSSIQKTTASLEKTGYAFNQFSTKLNSKGGLVDNLLTDTAVFSNIRSSVTQLKSLSTSAASLSQNLDNAGKKLNDKNNAIGVLLNDTGSAESLRRTMFNLESSSEKLNENLEALQHNFLLRGYFKKKTKEEEKELKNQNQQ